MNVDLFRSLQDLLGESHVKDDKSVRSLYSNDLSYLSAEMPSLVISPANAEELSQAVVKITEAGYSIVPRGAGFSYTKGYTPDREKSVVVDMKRFNRILEINVEDRYVVAECGVTWKEMHDALSPLGVRTPYWGPLSGRYATVGGALSQNSLFHGSGVYGFVADSVIGLRVVLGDGKILTTGSWANKNSGPFSRHFGPDVTGLFTSDSGAFGLKVAAVFKLVTLPKSTGFLSFKFDQMKDMIAAQIEIAKLGIASECYAFDQTYNVAFQESGVTFEQGLSAVGKIARKGGLKGLKQAAKIAASGKGVLKNVPYSLHMTLDGLTDGVVAEHADLVAEVCARSKGVEMTNSIPTLFRNEPFGFAGPGLVNAKGQVWVAVHAFFRLSRGIDVSVETEAFLEKHASVMKQHGVSTRFLGCNAGTDYLIETIFDWNDELGNLREAVIEPAYAKKWLDQPAAIESRALVLRLRDDLRDLYTSLGGLNLQLGKYYPYMSVMKDDALPELMRQVKRVVDPKGLINPGALGLDQTS